MGSDWKWDLLGAIHVSSSDVNTAKDLSDFTAKDLSEFTWISVQQNI